MDSLHWILYAKPGCHLCEGLEEKLRQIPEVQQSLEIRDITTRPDWWGRYELQIPVLAVLIGDQERMLPRVSPRSTVEQTRKQLIKVIGG